MRKVWKMLPGAVLVLVLGGGARGAEIITPVLLRDTSNSSGFFCAALNAGKKDVAEVTFQYFTLAGELLDTVTFRPFNRGRAFALGNGSAAAAYCKVSGKFPRKRVLVTYCVASGNGCISSIAAR